MRYCVSDGASRATPIQTHLLPEDDDPVYLLGSGILARSQYMQKLAPACGVTIPDQCPRQDGSDVTGTLVIANFDDVSFGALTELQKTDFRTKIAEDVAKDTGADNTGIAISTVASTGVLTVTFKVQTASVSQAVKVRNKLEEYNTARRGASGKTMGIKSLTSDPNSRKDPKLPVTGTTNSIAVSYTEVDKNTAFAVIIVVTMPYTEAEFDADKQTKYKKAVAKVAGTSEKNIELEIATARRRAGSIKVSTKILAGSQERLNEISKTLGSDETKLLSKLNKELSAQVFSYLSSPPSPFLFPTPPDQRFRDLSPSGAKVT